MERKYWSLQNKLTFVVFTVAVLKQWLNLSGYNDFILFQIQIMSL